MEEEGIESDSAIAPARSRRRPMQQAALIFACLAIFLGTLFLYSRQNNFSSFYHPDEFEKARQLLTHKRTYLHPQLLLEGTELALKISRQQPPADIIGVHQVILTGRWVSAIFAALAVTAFALIGYRYAGFTGFFVTAISVGLCPSILLNAHFMKEDTALLLGVAATLLATFLYGKTTPRTLPLVTLVFVGIAAGLAISGKYIGVVVLIAALAFISFPLRWPDTLSRCAVVLIAFSLTTALINHSIFFNWSAFNAGLGYEVHHVLIEHFGGTVMDRPNSFAVEALVRETMPHVLILTGAFLILLGLFWRWTTRWELFLVLFVVGFSIVLAFSIIPQYRYNLPVIAVLHLMAALLVAKYAIYLKSPLNWAGLLALAALIISAQSRRCLNYLDQFANDSHVRLRAFVAHNLPIGCVVAADAYALENPDDDPRLAEDKRNLPVTLQASFWVADLGDYDDLRALGVDFVAVSESAYGRFFDPHVRPALGDAHYGARRRFYEQLFARGELVWSSHPDPPTYSFINPALRLYRISGLR